MLKTAKEHGAEFHVGAASEENIVRFVRAQYERPSGPPEFPCAFALFATTIPSYADSTVESLLGEFLRGTSSCWFGSLARCNFFVSPTGIDSLGRVSSLTGWNVQVPYTPIILIRFIFILLTDEEGHENTLGMVETPLQGLGDGERIGG